MLHCFVPNAVVFFRQTQKIKLSTISTFTYSSPDLIGKSSVYKIYNFHSELGYQKCVIDTAL